MTEKKTGNISNSNELVSHKGKNSSRAAIVVPITFAVPLLVTSKDWFHFTLSLLSLIFLGYAALAMRYPDKFEFKNR
ncbi:hypothetical protein PUF88_00100 [Lactobacillaceae bacterium L1_55_11]|nr:hypothetical protein [Lactobacillaceae bacterium L1_55_11]